MLESSSRGARWATFHIIANLESAGQKRQQGMFDLLFDLLFTDKFTLAVPELCFRKKQQPMVLSMHFGIRARGYSDVLTHHRCQFVKCDEATGSEDSGLRICLILRVFCCHLHGCMLAEQSSPDLIFHNARMSGISKCGSRAHYITPSDSPSL
jgi:hypothetical protein